jgi:hypothetical protein
MKINHIGKQALAVVIHKLHNSHITGTTVVYSKLFHAMEDVITCHF